MKELEKGWVEITVRTVDNSIDTMSVEECDWNLDDDTLSLTCNDGDGGRITFNYPLRNVLCYTVRQRVQDE